MRSWSHRNRFRMRAVLFGAAIVASSLAARTEPQTSPDPFKLFQQMLPAIRHPRCTNCHGAVNPRTGHRHPGGIVPPLVVNTIARDTGCTLSCHTDADEWQLPGDEHFFEGRTDRQVCSQISDFVSTFGKDPFRQEHIRHDDQIIRAFDGFAGGAREPGKTYPDGSIGPPPEKPRITHQEFIKAADDWVLQGNAACDLEGSITMEEWVNSVDTIVKTPAHLHVSTQTGTRTVVVTAGANGFTADTRVDGKIVAVSTQYSTDRAGRPCTIVLTTTDTYSGSTRGPAKLVMKDTAFMVPPPQPPQTDYRIDVELPKEKTVKTTAHAIQDGCGSGITLDPGQTEPNDFDEWSFTLEGRVQDAKANAVGGCSKTVTLDQVGTTQHMSLMPCNRFGHMGNAKEPWLVNHGAQSAFHTGKNIPFNVTVTWNLKRR